MKRRKGPTGSLVGLVITAMIAVQAPARADGAEWPWVPYVAPGGQVVASIGLLAGQIESCQAMARLEFTEVTQTINPPGIKGKIKPFAWTQCLQPSDAIEVVRISLHIFKNGTDLLAPQLSCVNGGGSSVTQYVCAPSGDGYQFVSGDKFRITSYQRWKPTSSAAWTFVNTEACSTPSDDTTARVCRAHTSEHFIIP